MRVLFTTCPGHGHFFPMVPLAWASRAAGHEVMVAAPEGFLPVVIGTGLPGTPSSGPLDRKEIMRPEPTPDRESAVRSAGRGFGRMAAHTLDGLAGIVRSWKPDLLVSEPTEHAGPIAATAGGVPYAVQSIGLRFRPQLHAAAAAGFADVRRPGLDKIDKIDKIDEVAPPALDLDVCPPEFQLPGLGNGRPMRYVPYNGASALPPALGDPLGAPLVCVTAGSFLARDEGVRRLFVDIVDELGRMRVYVALAMDPDLVPLMGRLLDHVVAAGWLPLDLLLPRCALIVHHGGAGTVMTALTHGVPQLVIPYLMDGFDYADQVARTGVGRSLPATAGRDAVREAVAALLDDDGSAAKAAGVAETIAAGPAPARIVPELESIAQGVAA
ncbi:nucleotide disphospho-sugar-binding domain-containing protein [Actinomadura chokoriensis]|uniref:DUF1205 domain-containing protein n=1 Tax=Actinomadura chokoriensis TaxID=454156 RepID=A0ABV4R5J8_9ACTN